MKRLYYFLAILFLILQVNCRGKEEPFVEPEVPYIPDVPLNQSDSLTMIEVYNATGKAYAWGEWNFKDRRTWQFIMSEEINGELRITGINNTRFNNISIGDFPESFWKMSALSYLDISGSNYDNPDKESAANDTIPREIGNLKNLWHIRLDDLKISGNLPKELFMLEHLKFLILTHNNFSGTLPKEVELIPYKSFFDVSYNHFTGTIPLELLKNRTVEVYANDFTELPWECFYMDGYALPGAGYNRLSGVVPQIVLESEKWKAYDWRIGDQQPGYGYTVPKAE